MQVAGCRTPSRSRPSASNLGLLGPCHGLDDPKRGLGVRLIPAYASHGVAVPTRGLGKGTAIALMGGRTSGPSNGSCIVSRRGGGFATAVVSRGYCLGSIPSSISGLGLGSRITLRRLPKMASTRLD